MAAQDSDNAQDNENDNSFEIEDADVECAKNGSIILNKDDL